MTSPTRINPIPSQRSCLGAATLAALLLLGVILSFRLWLPFFGRWLVIADPLVPAQAIVPLAGGGERVNHAARLYKQGKAAWFVATNTPLDLPGIDHSYSDLVRRAALRGGVPEERFLVIPTLVYSTYEEALAIRRLAEMRGWDSLLIVTSPYHTRRARTIFNGVFGDSGIGITVRPVDPDTYNGDKWWQDSNNARHTVLEYLKFVAHGIGYH